MLFSTQLEHIAIPAGREKGIEILAKAGFPAIDITIQGDLSYILADDWRETALRYKEIADSYGVVFNQAHAPFGGGYDNYTKNLVPILPRVFEFVSVLGVKQVVVHPLQRGRYYGHEQELFEMNMEFYKSLAPHAKKHGVKICIENMWQNHPVTGHICDDVCADPHELVKYYDTLNDPEAFTICLDLGHVALCGREPEDAIRIIGHDRLGAIHVHDVDYVHDMHTLPGMGKLNWDAICHALADIKYKGEFTLEADIFMARYDAELRPAASKFMAEVAKHLTNKIEAYMAQ